jgi:predicted porin
MKTKYNLLKLSTSLVIGLGFVFGHFVYAQDIKTTEDFESWTSIGLRYDPTEKITLELQEQIRLNEDSSTLRQYFTQMNVSYDLTKSFQISGAYRWITAKENKEDVSYDAKANRYHVGISYKHDVNRINFSYRLRYQNKSFEDTNSPDNQFLRFRTKVKYNIKNWKLDPIASAELFNEVGGEPSKYRLTLATDYRIKKIGRIKVFFHYIKQLNKPLPKSTSVIGLSFIHKLNF